MKNEKQIETVAAETAAPASVTPFFARARALGLPRLQTHVKAGRKQEESEK
ncbi:MAG: hypothetical protein U0324_34915 [Polyangiales bacterium]